MEKLSFYYGIKPQEYWNYTYREAQEYCMCQMANYTDRLREEIIIQDAVSNKTIWAHPLNKRPKVESLTKAFKDLFNK